MPGTEGPCADCPIWRLADQEQRETYFIMAATLISKLGELSISQRRKGIISFRQTFEGEVARGHQGARLAARCAMQRLVYRGCDNSVPRPGQNT